MRLVVKQADRITNEFRFTKGPVYIGRHPRSQVFLPGRTVSRQHAVLYTTQEGKWVIEDLDSANKTYLNEEPAPKAELKTGDIIRIADYTIEINLENDADAGKAVHLEDTLTTPFQGPQIIVRKIDAEHAPDIRLPAKRAKDFVQATEAICKAKGPDEVLQALLSIILRQLGAFHVWCALRNQPAGPMNSYAGKQRDGRSVQLGEIKLSEKIAETVEKAQFLLLPNLPAQREEGIQSAIIAPVMGSAGCFGVLYVDNATDHEHYTPGDLDYLMLLAIHTATILKNF
jgi:hypothetical protein